MSQLFGLLNRAKYFFLFLFLELICFALIRKNNLQWDVTFFNSTNAVAANTMAVTHQAKEYLHLKEENESLSKENIDLRSRLANMEARSERGDYYYDVDSLYANRFNFKVAKVVNSTIALSKNYLTINKGVLDGVEPGMGVIGPRGVIGQVMSCSDHYSRVYSILHDEFRVSSEVVNEEMRKLNEVALGLCTWNGASHTMIQLSTIDKFKPISVGDSVVTSSQNQIFPANILVGKVSSVTSPLNGAFHKIDVQLSTDFAGLTYVYVVENKLANEQINLEREQELDE